MKYSAFVSQNVYFMETTTRLTYIVRSPTLLATLEQTSGSGANNSARVYHYHLFDDEILDVDLMNPIFVAESTQSI